MILMKLAFSRAAMRFALPAGGPASAKGPLRALSG